MSMPRHRDVPPEVHALADANAALRADKACLERDNVDLQALNVRLEQRVPRRLAVAARPGLCLQVPER
jgi:hypothetical protein